MISINTLTSAITAQRGLSISQPSLNEGLQNISTGRRINTPADDVAGSFIIERLNARIQGFDQGFRNANDALSILRTAEDSYQSANEAVLRIREIAVIAANSTTEEITREALQQEVVELVDFVNELSKDTKFNDVPLLDGSYFGKVFQTGSDRGDNVEMWLESVDPTSMGAIVNIAEQPPEEAQFIYRYDAINPFLFRGTAGSTGAANSKNISSANVIRAQTLTLNGSVGTDNVSISNFDTAEDIAADVNSVSANTGITADARTQVRLSDLSGTVNNGTVRLGTSGGSFSDIDFGDINDANDLTAFVNAVNDESLNTGISATFGSNTSEVILTNEDGKNIIIDDLAINGETMLANPVGTTSTVELQGGGSDSVVINGKVTLDSEEDFTLSSNVNDDNDNVLGDLASEEVVDATEIFDPDPDPIPPVEPILVYQDLTAIDVTSQDSASRAIDIADGAIEGLNLRRANVGAYSQRFELAANDVQNASENLTVAKSRIEDADFALESAKIAKGLVLQEIGVALLSQANAVPELALSLLTNN